MCNIKNIIINLDRRFPDWPTEDTLYMGHPVKKDIAHLP